MNENLKKLQGQGNANRDEIARVRGKIETLEKKMAELSNKIEARKDKDKGNDKDKHKDEEG